MSSLQSSVSAAASNPADGNLINLEETTPHPALPPNNDSITNQIEMETTNPTSTTAALLQKDILDEIVQYLPRDKPVPQPAVMLAFPEHVRSAIFVHAKKQTKIFEGLLCDCVDTFKHEHLKHAEYVKLKEGYIAETEVTPLTAKYSEFDVSVKHVLTLAYCLPKNFVHSHVIDPYVYSILPELYAENLEYRSIMSVCSLFPTLFEIQSSSRVRSRVSEFESTRPVSSQLLENILKRLYDYVLEKGGSALIWETGQLLSKDEKTALRYYYPQLLSVYKHHDPHFTIPRKEKEIVTAVKQSESIIPKCLGDFPTKELIESQVANAPAALIQEASRQGGFIKREGKKRLELPNNTPKPKPPKPFVTPERAEELYQFVWNMLPPVDDETWTPVYTLERVIRDKHPVEFLEIKSFGKFVSLFLRQKPEMFRMIEMESYPGKFQVKRKAEDEDVEVEHPETDLQKYYNEGVMTELILEIVSNSKRDEVDTSYIFNKIPHSPRKVMKTYFGGLNKFLRNRMGSFETKLNEHNQLMIVRPKKPTDELPPTD